jgi:hypothetical protein
VLAMIEEENAANEYQAKVIDELMDKPNKD